MRGTSIYTNLATSALGIRRFALIMHTGASIRSLVEGLGENGVAGGMLEMEGRGSQGGRGRSVGRVEVEKLELETGLEVKREMWGKTQFKSSR